MCAETTKERIHCNECQNKTLHKLIARTDAADSDENTGYWWTAQFDMLQCCGCQEVVLRRSFHFSEDNPGEADIRFFPPPMSRPLPRWRYDLPNKMRALLEEIYRSLDGTSLRLPMMGTRTLVDMLMVEKVGDRGSFKDKLEALEKAGYVSGESSKVLDAALDAGNAAAHRGHAATQKEVHSVMDIVENMLQAVYVFPDVAKELRKSTPPRTSSTAARKAVSATPKLGKTP